MATIKNRQIRSKAFLDILNEREFLRLFNAMGTEYIAEFDIRNNTLIAKLIDRVKLRKFKRGELKTQKPGSITNFDKNKFSIGRVNTIQLAKALGLLNSSQKFKGRFGFVEEDSIQTINLIGNFSVVAIGVSKAELKTQEEQWKENALRTPAQGRSA